MVILLDRCGFVCERLADNVIKAGDKGRLARLRPENLKYPPNAFTNENHPAIDLSDLNRLVGRNKVNRK